MLPKTYWDNLSEEAQIQFFNFYMGKIQGNFKECETCVSTFTGLCSANIENVKCSSLCTELFHNSHCAWPVGDCPCRIYKSDAFLALEKALIDSGWIEDENVLIPDKED